MTAGLTRRGFLTVAAGATGVAMLPAVTVSAVAAPSAHKLRTRHRIHAVPHSAERRVSLSNVHTGEPLDLVYWRHGRYLPDALRHAAHVMRDHRNGSVHPMDPKLLDLLAALHATLRVSEPFTLISGYRSPQTNAWLASMSGGVATNSLHMQGKAADVTLTHRSLAALHNAALHLRDGGVGYYPRSDFVHVDTGRVRQWSFG